MLDADKKDFANETKTLFIALNQEPPTKETLKALWDSLIDYDLKEVLEAYSQVIDEKSLPTIDNIKKWIEAQSIKNNYELKGDSLDWARKVLNKRHNPIAAVKLAKAALRIKDA